MKRILWFSEWLPTRVDPYAGDSIERHALAASSVAIETASNGSEAERANSSHCITEVALAMGATMVGWRICQAKAT